MKRLVIAFTLVIGFVSTASAGGIEPSLKLNPEAMLRIQYPAKALEAQVEGELKVYFELEEGMVVYSSATNLTDEKLRLEAIEFVNSLSDKELKDLCPSGTGKFILPISFKII